jgi:hypothetical protein
MAADRRPFLIGIAVLGLCGCVSIPQEGGPVQKQPSAPLAGPDFPAQIAILPMNNEAGDADGAIILRALAKHKLEKDLGYRIQPLDDTDQIIRDRTSVGPDVPVQVALAKQDPKTLAAWLGVDGVLHGELIAFNRAQLTIYTRSQVKARFWLTDKENKTLWQGGQDADSGTFGGGSVGISSYLTDSGISPETMQKINRSPLANATFELINQTFSTFPRRQ